LNALNAPIPSANATVDRTMMSAKLTTSIRFIVAYTPLIWVKAPRAVEVPKDPNRFLDS
jgi:hypothetical protein